MKFLLPAIFAIIVTCHFVGVHSMGKARISPGDQSDTVEKQGKPALNPNDVENDDEALMESKRVFGKVVDKVKQKYKPKNKKVKPKLTPWLSFFKHKWSKAKFLTVLKKLGVYDNKDMEVYTAPRKLILQLMKSKDNIIDDYKPPRPPCPADEEMPMNNNDGQEDAEISDQESTKDDDTNQEDPNAETIGEERDINNVEADADAIDQEHSDDEVLKKSFADLSQQDGNVEKRSGVTDLCKETFSTTYVLAHAKFNLAYRIPNVHCPVKQCFSRAIGLNLGRCGKKQKTMTVFVVDKWNKFQHKTVTIGCACECLFYNNFA